MDSLPNVLELLKSCLLPQLKEDLDTIPLQEEHFKSYHECLGVQLPLLYDWIQQEPSQWLFAVERNTAEQNEILSHLIILLCELSSPKYVFHFKNSELIANCNRILGKFSKLSPEVETSIFKYYEEKLQKDVWKRHLGAVHGFVRYLEFRYNEYNLLENKTLMNQQFLMFCLSVGLNVRTCYETHFKYLSTCILNITLKYGNCDDILVTNINSVIYDAIFKELHIMDSISFIEIQWNCLLKSFDFFSDMDSFTWSKLDDSMEILLRHIPLAPDSRTSISLMKFISKLLVYFNLNRSEFEEKLSQDFTNNSHINECRQFMATNTSYTCFRWAKTILQTFVLESNRLLQNPQICKEMLMEMHRCYMVTTLPIGLSILGKQLETFYEKFTAVLMETVRTHNFNKEIMPVITSFLETFSFQLQNCENTHNFFRFKESYCKLLEFNEFKNYKSTILS